MFVKWSWYFCASEECSEMSQCIIHLGQSEHLWLLWKSGENRDQILLLEFFSFWIKKYHLVPVFIHLCSYPSLSSTRLICGFSSCTWDFCFGRHLCSDNFFLTFGQGKNDTNRLKFISFLQQTPATDEFKSCYLSTYQSRAQIFVLPLVKPISLSVTELRI